MLISGVSEEEGRVGQGAARDTGDYQTADELFELMVKDHSYDINDDQSLNTRDLVILYKNIDVSTKLISNANGLHHKVPNQHVETVVYKDDKESDESDLSEIYSNEDLQDVCMINNERIDLINNVSCIQHNLCHKFGNLEMPSSNLTTEYDKQFLFKDSYIKHQLKNLNILPDCMGFDGMLPASLLDYIYCKRLEDNYTFYMDNIIRYVQHTIEQLKRISNGDYLTDRAREKWTEVAKESKIPRTDATKVLATSVSIPLHVEGKVNGYRSTWDDIVHSELDVRSLSKILEKKIIIEVPKLICGSYRIFSNRRADNLIISCKKDLNLEMMQNKDDSRVDVVFKLKRSESGHVISTINSIMILQNIPALTKPEPSGVTYQEIEFESNNDNLEHAKIVEIDRQDHHTNETVIKCSAKYNTPEASISDTTGCILSSNYYLSSSQSSLVDKEVVDRKVTMKTDTQKADADFTLLTPDELRCTIQRLNMQDPVLEESEEVNLNKKKSPTKIRIKSPYENKSFIMEEKKRKKLLEIRENRERRKMALNENCKISKHKYGKGAVMAQPSSSVTKLSITNKSFYNSIYGESLNQEPGITKKTRKWQRKEMELRKDGAENEIQNASLTILDKSSIDDGNTETVIQMHQNLEALKSPTPIFDISNFNTNANVLNHLITSSGTDCSISEDDLSPMHNLGNNDEDLHEDNVSGLVTSQWSCNLVPDNITQTNDQPSKHQVDSIKTLTPIECRKSIDKIYDLMKKLEKLDESETGNSTKHSLSNYTDNIDKIDGRRSSTIQISDSGTSVKHHVISSNPSNLSFEKNKNFTSQLYKDKKKKGTATASAVIPKVIISSKLQTSKLDADRIDRKSIPSTIHKVSENPLKAISQLLHEFDNVQKTRYKIHKRIDNGDGKAISRQSSSKKARQEQSKESSSTPVRTLSFKEKKSRSGQVMDIPQISNQVVHANNRQIIKNVKRNISDIIDEAKEARGEAVRGPAKPYSRLNTLAQPRKSYTQARSEEYLNKYGRNTMVQRTQRSTAFSPVIEKNIGPTSARNKRKGAEIVPVPATKPPIERIMKRSASNSPVRKRVLQPTTETSFKQIMDPEISENLKKKMVDVESYVKSHYGPINTGQIIGNNVHKSRVPLIPNDIKLESLTSSPIIEESAELGKKLHYMIDTMINTKVPCLSVLAECKESTSKLSNDGYEKQLTESLLKTEELKSESDYLADIFQDKSIETAVGCIPKDKTKKEIKIANNDIIDTVNYDIQSFNSATELRKLENALYQKMSVGAFSKRLRIKNLTLTPKQSLQQIIVVQSGDASSVLLKSSLSQSLKSSNCKTDSLTALKPLAVLSSTQISWGLTNIPMQVATIGYAFPTISTVCNKAISSNLKTIHQNEDQSKKKQSDVSKSAYKSNKTSQCFKGVHTESCLEQSTQANVVKCILSTCNIVTDPLDQQGKLEIELEQPIQEKCYKNITEPSSSSCIAEQRAKADIKDKDKEETANDSLENIDHSTSLGILMGLLNEIQKITCETNNKSTDNEIEEQCQELEVILNNTATNERDLLSVNHLDILQQVDLNPSTYSLKLFNGLDRSEITNNESKIVVHNPIKTDEPQNVDKEVSVGTEIQYVNKLTDVPSCFFSINTNYVTKLADSGIQVIRKPSTHSVYSVAKYEPYSQSTLEDRLEFQIPEKYTQVADTVIQIIKQPSTQSMYTVANCESCCYSSFDEVFEFSKIEETANLFNNKKHGELNGKKKESFLHKEQYAEVDRITVLDKSFNCTSNMLTKKTYLKIESDFDPLIKIKRDVLVTVYSILVFTVFAALSFPKVFYEFDI